MIYLFIGEYAFETPCLIGKKEIRQIIKKKCLLAVSILLNIDVKDLNIKYDDLGKPAIEYLDKRLYFSISYSDGFYAFSFSKIFSIGLDIEKIDVKRRAGFYSNVMSACFSVREKNFFECYHDIEYFWLAWTIKEAYSKYTGKGLREDYTKIEYIDNAVYIDKNIASAKSFSLIWNNLCITMFFDK